MLIDTLRYELPPEGATLLGYIVRRMHKTEWLAKASEQLNQKHTAGALEAAAIFAASSSTSFGRAYYQPRFNQIGETIQERDPATGALVSAKLEGSTPHYRISSLATMNNGDTFSGSETILGTTIGFRGLGMPAPSEFTFKAGSYQADFKGIITSELALSVFGSTKIRAYGSLDFKDTDGNKGHLELGRQGYASITINDQTPVHYALIRLMWIEKLKALPQSL